MLVMHTESVISLKTMNIKDLFPFNTFGNCFRQLKYIYVAILISKLKFLNIITIDDITNLIEDIDFKNKFIEYKKYITTKIENSYDILDKDTSYLLNKYDFINKGVIVRCLDYIILNNPNLFTKYINSNVLKGITQLKTFTNNIIKENDIKIIFKKYFSFYKSKKISVKTFIL
jgi:hypothetical protein